MKSCAIYCKMLKPIWKQCSQTLVFLSLYKFCNWCSVKETFRIVWLGGLDSQGKHYWFARRLWLIIKGIDKKKVSVTWHWTLTTQWSYAKPGLVGVWINLWHDCKQMIMIVPSKFKFSSMHQIDLFENYWIRMIETKLSTIYIKTVKQNWVQTNVM